MVKGGMRHMTLELSLSWEEHDQLKDVLHLMKVGLPVNEEEECDALKLGCMLEFSIEYAHKYSPKHPLHANSYPCPTTWYTVKSMILPSTPWGGGSCMSDVCLPCCEAP